MEILKRRSEAHEPGRNGRPFRALLRIALKIRRALLAALSHDVLGTAKAAAYSAILSLFPAVLVVTTLLALAPGAESVRTDLFSSFAEILPAEAMTLLHASFSNQNVRSGQVIFSAGLISLWAALGVMLSLMEGFRRAYGFSRGEWPFWMERLIALALIPSCLIPMAFATVIVAFGHQIELWILANIDHVLKFYLLLLWRVVRLAIGLLTTICVFSMIYHFGTPRRRHWNHVLAGAFGAAVIWFLATLLYGFYITRFANYSLLYGSLGTVVATLVWLYITSLSVLIGAELNAEFHPRVIALRSPSPAPKEMPAAKEKTVRDTRSTGIL